MKQEEGEKEPGEGGSWTEVQKAAGAANRGTSRRVASLGSRYSGKGAFKPTPLP